MGILTLLPNYSAASLPSTLHSQKHSARLRRRSSLQMHLKNAPNTHTHKLWLTDPPTPCQSLPQTLFRVCQQGPMVANLLHPTPSNHIELHATPNGFPDGGA